MTGRLLFASLAALAWADAAAAQQVSAIAPGGVPGIINEGPSAPIGAAALPQAAPIATDIRPDVAGPLALGTQVTRAGRNHVIDGGTRAGDNLFHSFSRFDLGQGDFARWVHSAGDPLTIRNVVNRVTGGDPSHIFGTLNSMAMPNADFYFINPAGIVFGVGASIDVPAAAHFSTAQRLLFNAGPAFTVATPGGSTFSVANPAAFGFVGGQGDIAVDGLANEAFTGTRISFTGRNVAIGNSVLAADGYAVVGVGSGAAELSVAAPRGTSGNGRVEIADSILRSRASDGILVSAGSVRIDTSTLGTAFTPGPRSGIGGPINISGGNVTIFGSLVSASTSGAEDAGEIRIAGNEILISGSSMIQSETNRGSTGAAGGIAILGGNVIIEDRSRVSSSTLTAQRAGDIQLSGNNILIDRSVVASDSRVNTTGDAGRITVTGGELRMRDGSALSSTSDGQGNAGFVNVAMRDGIRLSRSIIASEARGTGGESGVIRLAAPLVLLEDEALVSTSTSTSGDAGEIGIASDDVRVLGRSIIQSESGPGAAGNAGVIMIGRQGARGGRLLVGGASALRSDTNGPGDAGGIFIATDEVELRDGGSISSDAGRGCAEAGCVGLGNAGDIGIEAVNLRLTEPNRFLGGTRISSDSIGGKDGGDIRIALSGDLTLEGAAQISSDTTGEGRGGNIEIVAQNVRLRGSRGGFSATTFGSGAGGSIEVTARETISIEDDAEIVSGSGDGKTNGSAPPGRGDSGDIRLNARQLRIANGGTVSATTYTDGAGGAIVVRAGRLVMEDIANITSASHANGAGGSIDIVAGELVMRGFSEIDTDALGNCVGENCLPGGAAGDIRIKAGRIEMVGRAGPDDGVVDIPRISSDTEGAGDAGNIVIDVDGLLAMDFAAISSLTRRAGDAGLISINAGTIELLGRSLISTNSNPFQDAQDHGDAGEVAIAASGNIFVGEGSEVVSNTGGSGGAGQVTVATPGTLTIEGGRLSSGSLPGATGTSGKVGVTAGQLFVINGSIETISRNTNRAGDIGIIADTIQLAGRAARIASINTSAAPGSAGTVLIEARMLTLSNGAAITTESATGPAGDILISMPGDGILTLESLGLDTPPSVITTSSGPGTGGQIAISRPRAIISNGGSILALGQQGGANVQLDAQYLISSSDRTNRIEVNGNFLLEAAAYDVSAGTVNRDLSVIDASGVLRGQCAAVRATGQVSQLVVRPIGPYGARPTGARPTVAPPTGAEADRTRLLSAAELQESCS